MNVKYLLFTQVERVDELLDIQICTVQGKEPG